MLRTGEICENCRNMASREMLNMNFEILQL